MLLSNLNILATAPGGVARLRELILTLAVQGKLVPQDPTDEPASELLKKIRAEKDRLVAAGKIKRDKPLAEIVDEERPFELPLGWKWVRAIEICTLITDGDHLPPPKADSGIPFLVIGDVRDGFVDLQRVSRCVPTDYFDKLDWGKKPLLGDILYTTVGSFGIPVPIAMQQDFCFQRHIALFRPAIVDLQDCLALIFRSALIYQQAEAGATGIAQKTVPLSALRNLHIPLPPLAEQSRIVTRVEELMRLCDALEAKGQLEATQHAQLVSTLLGTLTESETPEELAENWQRIATHFDLLLDRPEAVDALEQTILQLAVRGLLVPQDPKDEPASELLKKIRAEKDRLIAAKELKREKDEPALSGDSLPFDLPESWSWAAMGEVIDIVRGITFPATHKTREAAPGRIACLRTTNVQQSIEWDDLLFVDRSFMGREDQLIHHHDIVMSMANSRELVGKVALIDQIPHVEATFGGFLGVLRPRKIDPRYAMAVLRTPYARALLIDSSSQTTNIANVSLAKMRPLPFPLPPAAEQSRIVARVAQLRCLCADMRQRLTAANERQSQLAQALVEMQSTTTV